MSILVVGDQGVGKTTLMLELAKLQGGMVQVISPSLADLTAKFTLANQVKPTSDVENTPLQIQVMLQGVSKQFTVNWIDAPGEVWRPDSPFISNRPTDWQMIESQLKTTQAMIVIMAPYRELLKDHLLQQAGGILKTDIRFRTLTQWKRRLREWLIFLHQNCAHTHSIVFCLNFADLFCNVNSVSQTLAESLKQGWFEYKGWMLQQYFSEVMPLINQYDATRSLPCQLFITTHCNRTMLEAPWLYLGTYL